MLHCTKSFRKSSCMPPKLEFDVGMVHRMYFDRHYFLCPKPGTSTLFLLWKLKISVAVRGLEYIPSGTLI